MRQFPRLSRTRGTGGGPGGRRAPGAKATTKKKAAATPPPSGCGVGNVGHDEPGQSRPAPSPAATEELKRTSSIPGKVTAVNVKAGQNVVKGQVLGIIDSARPKPAPGGSAPGTGCRRRSRRHRRVRRRAERATDGRSSQLSSDQSSNSQAQTALAGVPLVALITGKVVA